jgi:hypothetical protein
MVVGWVIGQVAGAAFVNAGMIISYTFPVGAVSVASDACTKIMIVWDILKMAGLTFDDAHVVELKGCPVINDMAIRTFARKVIRVEKGSVEIVVPGKGREGIDRR